jgi:hypothetical protein
MSLETAFLLLGWGSLGTILVTAICSSSNQPEADRVRGWVTRIIWTLTVLGLVFWLVTLPDGIATKAGKLSASEWAAWVQAIFSIIAICVVIGQNFLEKWRKERDRDDRAKVVVAGLSVWLGEIGSLVEIRLQDLQKIMIVPKEFWSYPARLDVSGGIESVMTDLHYLRKGSADVAQLHFFSKEFDKLIDKAHGDASSPRIQPDLLNRLKNMKQLHGNAMRLLEPVMQDAVKDER